MHQALDLERLLCKSKFMPVEENFHVNSCGKNCVFCSYLLKAFSYLFKRVNKVFSLKNESLFPLRQIKQENKLLRKAYQYYFIDLLQTSFDCLFVFKSDRLSRLICYLDNVKL